MDDRSDEQKAKYYGYDSVEEFLRHGKDPLRPDLATAKQNAFAAYIFYTYSPLVISGSGWEATSRFKWVNEPPAPKQIPRECKNKK